MQPFQYEADTTAGPSSPIFYTDGGIESGALSRTADSAPTNAAASETLTYTLPNTAVSFGWISPANVPNSTSWPAQTYTISLNIAQPNANVKVTAVHILRLDSAGDGGGGDEGLAIVGETTGLSQSLGNAGTYTFTVSGAAQTASAADRLGVKIVVESTASGTQSFSYLAGQNSGSGVNVVTNYSLDAAGSAGPSTPIFYTNGSVETGNISVLMSATPQVASTPETITYGASSGAVSFGWVSPANAPNSTSWPAQTYNVTLNVTQANPNITITAVRILRVDSSGDGGGGDEGLATVASLNTLSQPLSSPGVLHFTLTGTAQTASATDRIAVKIVANNSATSTQSFSYLAGINSGSGINLPDTGALSQSATGILPWWTYDSGNLPGQGTYLLNVANGNLIVKTTDVDAPERGLDLAFERIYNSQSTHDANNTDGSLPANFGDGWTNSFDAHLAYDGTNTISVYDTDGARFDYTADGQGGWTPPPGEHAKLEWDASCGYFWTKPDGIVYHFYSPDLNETTNCSEPYPTDSAYGGRLYQIFGRNHNNNITFTYSWVGGNASNPNNIAGITATHSDGDRITVAFGTSGGAPEMSTLTRPDGKVISYLYSGTTVLVEAILPGTNGPGSNAVSSVDENYYYNAPHQLWNVWSPVLSGTVYYGDETTFHFDSSNRVNQTVDYGVVNFVPTDGTSTALQGTPPPAGSLETWTTTNFTYASGETELSDMDGHYVNWFFDTPGRVTKTQRWSFTPSGQPVWVSTGQSWDSSNNLLSVVDPRGMVGSTPDPTYETDFAYDAAGDLVAAAQPNVTVNNGTYRPTYLFSYDSNHNLIAACDPVHTDSAAVNRNWSGLGQNGNPFPNPSASPTPCPSTTGATVYAWATPAASPQPEPYGELKSVTSPNGYTTSFAYSPASEDAGGVDVGLPTAITGAPISQSSDGSTLTRTPTWNATYDPYGDLKTTNAGTFNSVTYGTTTYAYDAMHRQISATDAENVTSYWCYNDDGSVLYTESAAQHAADGLPAPCSTPLGPQVTPPVNSDWFTYDADGNETAAVHHYGNVTGTTTNWYDGGDRLVEVQLPLDQTDFSGTSTPHDLYPKSFMTRYLYDNTGQALWNDGSGNVIYGSGHLYKVQEYVPSTPVVAANTVPAAQTWTDVRGWAWDPLDVPVHVYEFALPSGTSPRMSYTYNGSNATMGRLTQAFYGQGPSSTNTSITPTYLANGWISATAYANDGGVTPSKNFIFDADGRPVTLYSSIFTNETRLYDSDGNLTEVKEPTSYTGAADIKYSYYLDDKRESISVTSSSIAAGAQRSISYGYRTDGLTETLQPSWTGSANFTIGYSNAGRRTSESDPETGNTVTVYNSGSPEYTVKLGARSTQYDQYGQIKQVVLPEGYTYSNFMYDDEGEPTSYDLSGGWCTSGSRGQLLSQCTDSTENMVYSARGELLNANNTNSGHNTMPNLQSAVNFLCTPSTLGGCKESFDARNGMALLSGNVGYGYDAYGRNTGITLDGAGLTRSYDADSHIVSEQNPTAQTISCSSNDVFVPCNANEKTNGSVSSFWGVKYTWSPGGHPVEQTINASGGATGTTWEHWDPATSTVLFEYEVASGLGDLAVGRLGITSSSNTDGVTVEDRDPFGQVAATHTNVQFSVWGAMPAGRSIDTMSGTYYAGAVGSGFVGSDPMSVRRTLSAARDDGYIDHGYALSFQGTRAADIDTSTWTTMDWYGGSSGDVMSQQPYMWNNNNGLMNSDPTGSTDCGRGKIAPVLSCVGTQEQACMEDATSPLCTGDQPSNNSVFNSVDQLFANADAALASAWQTYWKWRNQPVKIYAGTGPLAFPIAGRAASALEDSVEVAHYTNAAGAAAIRSSGYIRADSFVTFPGAIPEGASASQIEQLLEIDAGKGTNLFTFRVPYSALRIPDNGPLTSGGIPQAQLNIPIGIP